jgi:hypothetical protein
LNRSSIWGMRRKTRRAKVRQVLGAMAYPQEPTIGRDTLNAVGRTSPAGRLSNKLSVAAHLTQSDERPQYLDLVASVTADTAVLAQGVEP